MQRKIKSHISVFPEVMRNFRVLAARHGVRQGAALAGLLTLAESRPALEVAAAMAGHDDQEGELVPDGADLSAYIEGQRAGGAADPEHF